MSNDTAIANRALTKVGDQRILSLLDDTNAGRTLNSMFTLVRDAELRRHRWKFSITRTSLLALVTAPAWGYQYQFPLPSDYLALVQVNDFYVRPMSKNAAPWSIERSSDGTGTVLLTDLAAPLYVRYVSRVEDSSLFDPLFVESFACKLAYEACEALTQSNTKKDSLAKDYQFSLTEAVRVDAIELPPDELPWGSWLESREGASVGLKGSSQFYGTSGFTVG